MEKRYARKNGEPCAVKAARTVRRGVHVPTSSNIGWPEPTLLLGALLLKLAMEPQYSGLEDYLQSIVMNLCIGLSMLFIPIAAKSIINDGVNGAASAIAVLPAMATAQAIKTKTMGLVKNPFDKKKTESQQQKSKPTINKRGI